LAIDPKKVNQAFWLSLKAEVDIIEDIIDGAVEEVIQNHTIQFPWGYNSTEIDVVFNASRLDEDGHLPVEVREELERRYKDVGWLNVRVEKVLPHVSDIKFQIFLTRPTQNDDDPADNDSEDDWEELGSV
jgi:hypothetical protein